MHPAAIDRSTRGHQCLGRDLPTEGPLALLLGVLAPVGVDFDGLEVEQGEQKIKRVGHAPLWHRACVTRAGRWRVGWSG